MTDVTSLVIRVAFSYLALLALLRASHKRLLAEVTPFDFVLALVLGDMIDDVLWGEVGAATFTVAVGALALCQAIVSLCSYLSPAVYDLVVSSPTVLLRDGVAVPGGLRAEGVSESELEELLRLEGISRKDWRDVRTLRLEASGQASVAKRRPAREARKRDVGRS
jgi:uncharacterized membrane protein YcaP (DUF421 family)